MQAESQEVGAGASMDAVIGSLPPPLPASGRPVAGFFLDLLISIAVLLLLSVAAGLVWALYRIVQVTMQGGILADPESVVSALGQPGALAMIWMTLVSTGGAAVVVYYWRRRATAVERAASQSAMRRSATWGWILATAAVTFLFSSGMSALGQAIDVAPQPTNLPVIQAAFASSPVFMSLFGMLIAPAYEELLFRRVLFGRLWEAGRPWLGLVLSSAAFALMHEIPGTSGNSLAATGLLWLTYAFMGAAFALVYWRTRTLWAAIAAHALNNAIAMTLLKLYGE